MFGLDLLFDLDKNGKLDAFERAAEMEFLDIVDSGLQTGKPGKKKDVYNSDLMTIGTRRKSKMKIIYFTITGTKYRFGHEFMKPGMKVKLIKEPDNPYDSEAIRVEMAPLSKIGYVANSTKTVIGDSWSAGRMYDHIGKKADAVVKLVTERGVLCKVCKKSLR